MIPEQSKLSAEYHPLRHATPIERLFTSYSNSTNPNGKDLYIQSPGGFLAHALVDDHIIQVPLT